MLSTATVVSSLDGLLDSYSRLFSSEFRISARTSSTTNRESFVFEYSRSKRSNESELYSSADFLQ